MKVLLFGFVFLTVKGKLWLWSSGIVVQCVHQGMEITQKGLKRAMGALLFLQSDFCVD